LLTYHLGNGPRDAGDREVTQELNSDDGSDYWRCFNFENDSGGSGDDWWSSSKQQLGVGGLGPVG
jgi:hypothetical protein